MTGQHLPTDFLLEGRVSVAWIRIYSHDRGARLVALLSLTGQKVGCVAPAPLQESERENTGLHSMLPQGLHEGRTESPVQGSRSKTKIDG